MRTLAIILSFISIVACAQKNEYRTSGQLYFGRSFLGTGDVFGIEYGGIYSSAIRKKSFWFAEIGGSIHDDDWPLFYSTQSGEWIDASIHYTTAAVQLVGGVGLKIFQSARHEINLKFGAVARYQSSSNWDYAEVIYPPLTGLDFPVARFVNTTPKKTMSLGGRGSFSYSYTFKSNLFVSVIASLQTDSNGDTLTSTALGFGRKF